MTQLFEKVDLHSEAELLKIHQLLDEALHSRLQEAGDDLTEVDRQELLASSADFVEQLRQFVVFAEEQGGPGSAADTQRTRLTPYAGSLALRSPLLKPLSPPPADAEVRQLEAQVTAASLRVAELRTSMQARLQETLAAKLAACRPTADLDPDEQRSGETTAAATGGSPTQQQQQEQPAAGEASQPAEGCEDAAAAQDNVEQEVQPMESDAAEVAPAAAEVAPAAEAAPPAIPLSPDTQELQQRLLQAANRMPALRARLEQAADKLQRVVAAVAADISRPPPNTVEKAVLGKTPAKAAAPGAENVGRVSPLVQQALESGQISTRRRVARDVQAVPYNGQAE